MLPVEPLDIGRLILVVMLFGPSLLAIFRAPTSALWKPAIVATEAGPVMAPIALMLALTSRSGLESVLASGAVLLLTTPMVRAWWAARPIPRRFATTFGDGRPRTLIGAPARPAPLSVGGLYAPSPFVAVDRFTYRDLGVARLELDLYRRNDSPKPRPLVIAVHGGSWSSGDNSELPGIYRYLAARGYGVAAIDYRLAPEHVFPAALDDVCTSVAYLREHADEFGLDPTRVVLLGRSAGGHLALLAAYRHRELAIRGVAAYYPPSDMDWSWHNPSNPRVLDSRATQTQFLGGSLVDVPHQYRDASPIEFVDGSSPPTLLLHGRRDELVACEQSRRLARRLDEQGVPHLLLELPWATHGFDASLVGPGGQISTWAIERFAASVTASAGQ